MFRSSQLLHFEHFVYGFSTVSDGNMSFSFGDKQQVIINRKKFLNKQGIKMKDCVAMWVEHKDKIVIADRSLTGKSMLDYQFAVKTDGLVTNQKGLYLFLLIADCLPVIIFNPVKEVVGLVHAGWKNTDINIVNKVIQIFRKQFKSKSKDLFVGFGPAARKESYLKEFPKQLNDPKWKGYISKVVDLSKYQIDFVGLCKDQLIDAGVKEDNIFDSGVDTIRDKRFFSHYRDSKNQQKDQGRFACVVGLK